MEPEVLLIASGAWTAAGSAGAKTAANDGDTSSAELFKVPGVFAEYERRLADLAARLEDA